MERQFSKLHKTDTRSVHVLNLRGTLTPARERLEAQKKALTFKVKRRKEMAKKRALAANSVAQKPPQQLATLRSAPLSQSQQKKIPSKYAEHLTLELSTFKVLTLILMATFSFSAVFVGVPTLSLFADDEVSNDNAFTTGLVDFVLVATPFQDMATTTASTTGEIWNVDVVPNETSNPFYYYASSTNFHGNLDFCDAINVVATLEGEVMYEGPLTELFSATTTVISEWRFEFSDYLGDFPGQMCHFDIDFNGWQTRHGLVDGGYSDTETVSYWIEDPSMVIAKVFFESDTHEWVELYNPTHEPIDISGWYLCDNNACDALPPTPPIPPDGFVLVIGSEEVLTEIFVPPSVTVVVIPDGEIGDGLDNDADMLQLVTSEDLVADQLNWGDPDNGWPYYNLDLWVPGLIPPVAPGALMRQPVDQDTHEPTDFIVLSAPSLDLLYPTPDITTWLTGSTQEIEWSAVNPNGDDNDLQIDIYYVDTFGDMHVIVEDTPNDGSYEWMVPDDLLESILIKIVATSPENILLNSVDVSNRIQICPAETGCGTATSTVLLRMDKHISGETNGFSEDQFSYHVVGTGVDVVVWHGGSTPLPIGTYTIEEIVPEGFVKDDWRIGWYGECEAGDTFTTTITIDDSNIDDGTLDCQADNQYRPRRSSNDGYEKENKTNTSTVSDRSARSSRDIVRERDGASSTPEVVLPEGEVLGDETASNTVSIETETFPELPAAKEEDEEDTKRDVIEETVQKSPDNEFEEEITEPEPVTKEEPVVEELPAEEPVA